MILKTRLVGKCMVRVKIVECDLESSARGKCIVRVKIMDCDLEILERGYIYKVWAEILYGDLELAIVEFDLRL